MSNVRTTSNCFSYFNRTCLVVLLLMPGCDQSNNGRQGPSNGPKITNISPPGYAPGNAGADNGLGSRRLYQARAGSPRFQISNLQKMSNDRFELDWQRSDSAGGIGAGHFSLVLRFPSQRNPVTIPLTIWDNESHGKISGHVISIRFGGPRTQEHALDRGCEMFLADTMGLEIYKLSNSITVGGVSELPTETPPVRTRPSTQAGHQSNLPAQPVPIEKEPVAETELVPLPSQLNVKEGIYLYAQLNGNWIPVKVVGVEGGGKTRVRWLGFSESWDASLNPDQLRVKLSDLELLTPKP